MGYTFISYSRKQLYFAEAITLHLQKYGIEAWFDLQQLGAGTDWASTLKSGYENCERLVLVASQTALASPYVEVEWDTALKNGREVILAVVEDVSIPEELRNCPIIDFRSSFRRPIRRLVSYLTGESPSPKDPIQAPGRFPYPLRLPLMIWLTLAVLILPYLGMFAISLDGVRSVPAGTAAILIIGSLLLGGGVFAVGTHRFWTHNLNYQGLRYLSGFALVVQLAVLALASYTGRLLSFTEPVYLALLANVLLNVLFYLWIMDHSAALLRWYSAGQVPQKLRRRFHAPLLKKGSVLQDETIQLAPVSFAVRYDRADKPLAAFVARVLRQSGHTEVEDVSQAEKQIYIITNRTTRTMIEEAGKKINNDSIFLLGSSVDWCDSFAYAAQTQFVDFRENDPQDLKMLAKSLSNMDAWRRQYALEATPKKFEVFDAPTGVQVYRFLGYMQAATMIGAAIAAFLNGPWYKFVFLLACGMGLFVLVERALQRRVTFRVAFGVLVGPGLVTAIFTGQYFTFIPFLLMAWAVFHTGRYWFPSKAPVAGDAVGMDAAGLIKRWGRVIVAVVAVFSAFVTILMVRIGAM
ncbi:MAG TPA: toll/interleukin-1 receptor domain-containing protein [Anaerolineales bacterium]|nr:toll/interleukin-1 receptor domain-containing protein [Anaerolineales bacterium]